MLKCMYLGLTYFIYAHLYLIRRFVGKISAYLGIKFVNNLYAVICDVK